MDEQMNLFAAMGEPLPPMQVVCDYLRSSYDNWLRHRLPEEKVRPLEAVVDNLFKTWHGHSLDWHTGYWFISFRPSSVTLKSNDGLDIDFSRTAVLRALGIREKKAPDRGPLHQLRVAADTTEKVDGGPMRASAPTGRRDQK